jgi:hypothetical protein
MIPPFFIFNENFILSVEEIDFATTVVYISTVHNLTTQRLCHHSLTCMLMGARTKSQMLH